MKLLVDSDYMEFKPTRIENLNDATYTRQYGSSDLTVEDMLCEKIVHGVWQISFADTTQIVIAWLRDAWRVIGEGDDGLKLASEWHLIPNGCTLPQPKHVVGDRVWIASVELVEDKVTCPDCLGSGAWKVISPAGTEATIDCPRCHGRKVVSVPTWKGFAREFTIGSVEVRTAPNFYEGKVTYYDQPSCSGLTLQEWDIFDSKQVAEQEARQRASEHESLVGVRRDLQRELRSYTIFDAKVREVEAKLWRVEYDYERLRARILDLDKHDGEQAIGNSLSRFGDDPALVVLTKEQLRAVANELMWINDDDAQWLIDAREARDKECKC